MPNYRRAIRPGGTFFFTQVTYRRMPIFGDAKGRELLRRSIAECRESHPFAIEALVLLPDHLHTVWTLPEDDGDFSTRWRIIKSSFTRAWLSMGGGEGAISESRRRNQRRGVWQRRFWEHCIRDGDDLRNHLNYIHFNPVKHRLAGCPHEWPHSTFAAAVERGWYGPDWCCGCEGRSTKEPVFEGVDGGVME